MAIVDISPFLYPTHGIESGAQPYLLDAAGEKLAFIVQAGKTGNVHKIHFSLWTVTTGQTIKVSLQDVSTTDGFPDGVADQSGTVAVADTDDFTYKVVTLGSDRAVTQGDIYSIVIEFNVTVGNLEVNASSSMENNTAYVVNFTGGTWAKQSRGPLVGIEYSDGSFAYHNGVISGVGTVLDYTSASSPDEFGVKFRLPISVRVIGANMGGRMSNPIDTVLYDSDGSTVLATGSIDPDQINDVFSPPYFRMFSTPVTLAANTYYRLTKKADATGTRFAWIDCFSAASLDQMSGGQDWHMTKRTDAGAWTDVTTQRPWASLLVNGIDAGGGGATVIVRRGGLACKL